MSKITNRTTPSMEEGERRNINSGYMNSYRKDRSDSGYDSTTLKDEAIKNVNIENVESEGKKELSVSFDPRCDDKLVFKLTPGNIKIKRLYELKLSPTIRLEIPSSAIHKEVQVTARIVNSMPHPLCLGDYEFILTDILELGVEPQNIRFKEPVTFRMEVNDPEALDKTRDIVVRTSDKSGKWTDLQTKLSPPESKVREVTAEMDHFCNLIVVSKIHTFDVCGDHDVHISISDGEVTRKDDDAGRDGSKVRLSVEVVKIDRKLLQRAREITTNCPRNLKIAFDTVVKIKKVTATLSGIVVTMKVPTEKQTHGLEKLRILRDNDNDNWVDVSNTIQETSESENTVTFKAKAHKSDDSRYVVVVTDTDTEVKEIVNAATSLARKGLTLVQFLLLQHKERHTSLVVDCVEEKEREARCREMLVSNGFAPSRGFLHYTREVDVAEGEKIQVNVGGKYIEERHNPNGTITFYSRTKCNQKQILVGLRDDAPEKDEFEGSVDFVRLQNPHRTDDTTLFFAISMVRLKENKIIAKNEEQQSSSASVSKLTTKGQPSKKDVKKDDLSLAIDILLDRLSAKEWKPLARQLGVTDAKLSVIEAENKDDVREQMYKMFAHWRSSEGKDATLQALIKALKSQDLRKLAESLGKLEKTDSNVFTEERSDEQTRTSPASVQTANTHSKQKHRSSGSTDASPRSDGSSEKTKWKPY